MHKKQGSKGEYYVVSMHVWTMDRVEERLRLLACSTVTFSALSINCKHGPPPTQSAQFWP